MTAKSGVNGFDSAQFLIQVDIKRRTIDAADWLLSLSDWYRPAAAGIVRHWAGMLASPVVRAGTAAEWIQAILGTARRLTPPCTSPRMMRGILEWRHPEDRLSADPIHGLCWVDPADSTYLCWTGLVNLQCLGGWLSTQDLKTVTPLGGAGEEIVTHILHNQAKAQP